MKKMANSASIEAEYVQLWNKVTSNIDINLPCLVASGLATQKQKISSENLETITYKHRSIVELRRQLQSVDNEYRDLLASLAAHVDEGNYIVNDDRKSRIADFLYGLIASLRLDFSQEADLVHAMQQIYLFQTSSS